MITTFATIARKIDVKVMKQRKHPGAAMGTHATLTFSPEKEIFVMCAVKIFLLVAPVSNASSAITTFVASASHAMILIINFVLVS